MPDRISTSTVSTLGNWLQGELTIVLIAHGAHRVAVLKNSVERGVSARLVAADTKP